MDTTIGPERPAARADTMATDEQVDSSIDLLEQGLALRAAKFWSASLVFAALLVLASAFVLLAETSPPAQDLGAYPGALSRTWSFLRVSEPDAWWLISILLAIAAALITLFIASILAGHSEMDTGWTRLARKMSRDVIFQATPFLALLAWLGLPSVLHQGTFLIGIPVVLGVSLISAVLRQLTMPPNAFKTEQERAQAVAAELHHEAFLLHDRSRKYLADDGSRRLSQEGRRRLAVTWAKLGMTTVISAGIGLLIIALTGARGGAITWVWAALIIFGLLALHGALGAAFSKDHALPGKKRNWWLVVIVAAWNLPMGAVLIFAAEKTGLTLWSAVGVLVPLIFLPIGGFVACFVVFSRAWFSVYRWWRCVRKLERSQQQATDSSAFLAVQNSQTIEKPPSVPPSACRRQQIRFSHRSSAVAVASALLATVVALAWMIWRRSSGQPDGPRTARCHRGQFGDAQGHSTQSGHQDQTQSGQ